MVPGCWWLWRLRWASSLWTTFQRHSWRSDLSSTPLTSSSSLCTLQLTLAGLWSPRRSRTRYFDTEEDILAADAWQSSVWRSRWSACPQDGLAGDLCRRNIEDVHCSVQFLGSKWTTLDRRLMLIWLEWIYVIDLRRLLAFRYSIEYST